MAEIDLADKVRAALNNFPPNRYEPCNVARCGAAISTLEGYHRTDQNVGYVANSCKGFSTDGKCDSKCVVVRYSNGKV